MWLPIYFYCFHSTNSKIIKHYLDITARVTFKVVSNQNGVSRHLGMLPHTHLLSNPLSHHPHTHHTPPPPTPSYSWPKRTHMRDVTCLLTTHYKRTKLATFQRGKLWPKNDAPSPPRGPRLKMSWRVHYFPWPPTFPLFFWKNRLFGLWASQARNQAWLNGGGQLFSTPLPSLFLPSPHLVARGTWDLTRGHFWKLYITEF